MLGYHYRLYYLQNHADCSFIIGRNPNTNLSYAIYLHGSELPLYSASSRLINRNVLRSRSSDINDIRLFSLSSSLANLTLNTKLLQNKNIAIRQNRIITRFMRHGYKERCLRNYGRAISYLYYMSGSISSLYNYTFNFNMQYYAANTTFSRPNSLFLP
jgi:hypothetical protein